MKNIMKHFNIKLMALYYLILIATVLMTTSLVFILGGSINSFILPISFIIAMMITYYLFAKGKDKKTFAITMIISHIIFFLCTVVAGMFYDVSWDGNAYHKEMIGLMKNGWNPLYNLNVGEIWTAHYANGSEMFGAVVYALFENIETAKVLNWLLVLSLGILAFDFLYQKSHRKLASILIAIVLAVNPIFLAQFTANYIDAIVANTLFLAILALIKIIDDGLTVNRAENWTIFITSTILCINAKYTALLIVGLFTLLLGAFIVLEHWVKKDFKKTFPFIGMVATTFLIGFLFVGSSTYVKNVINYGHPFYPLYGENAVPSFVDQPELFNNFSHIHKFVHSLFSKTNTWYRPDPELKIPFTVYESEMNSIKYPDIRIGGLGVWYSGILLLSIPILLGLFIYLCYKKSKWAIVLALFGIGIVGPIPILPMVWQLRYYPQFYLIPILAAGFLICYPKKWANITGIIFTIIMIGNCAFFLPQAYDKWKFSMTINRDMVYLANLSLTKNIELAYGDETLYGLHYNFIDKGIRYTFSEEPQLDGEGIYFKMTYRVLGDEE